MDGPEGKEGHSYSQNDNNGDGDNDGLRVQINKSRINWRLSILNLFLGGSHFKGNLHVL